MEVSNFFFLNYLLDDLFSPLEQVEFKRRGSETSTPFHEKENPIHHHFNVLPTLFDLTIFPICGAFEVLLTSLANTSFPKFYEL